MQSNSCNRSMLQILRLQIMPPRLVSAKAHFIAEFGKNLPLMQNIANCTLCVDISKPLMYYLSKQKIW